MTPSEWIQLGGSVVLFFTLLAVLWYAWEARQMTKAAKEQVEASVNMAEEAKQQRRDSVKPVVVFRGYVTGTKGGDILSNIVDVAGGLAGIALDNIGIGPALDVRALRPLRFLPPLGSGEHSAAFTLEDVTEGERRSGHELMLEVTYKDVFGNSVVTLQKLRRNEQHQYEIVETRIERADASSRESQI